MAFPWAKFRTRLVEEHLGYWVVVEQPQAYIDALEELEVLLSGAYDGPKEGCPVGGEAFVDRGNVAAFDFGIANFTANGAWQVKDLSAIVTDADATRVLRYAMGQRAKPYSLLRVMILTITIVRGLIRRSRTSTQT
jgi:hypothetical protein